MNGMNMKGQGFGAIGGANPQCFIHQMNTFQPNMGMGMNMNPMCQMGQSRMNQMNSMCSMGMMNPCMMPQMNPMNQMGSMTPRNTFYGMNPFVMQKINPFCQMNPMCMMNNLCMMPRCSTPMGKRPLTAQEKQQIRINGYLCGKMMAKMKNQMNKSKMTNKTVVSNKFNQPAKGLISVKFIKGNSVIKIKMDAKSLVAELLNEYFLKSHTTNGNFKYNGQTLLPNDSSSLAEAGLNNGSVIYVS